METKVKITWDKPEMQEWLCADNIKIALSQHCKNTKFDVQTLDVDTKLISAAPEMFEALKRVEAYLVANEDVLAPFPTRSELDNIRAVMFKTGLYQYNT
jgi:hypothetical protein